MMRAPFIPKVKDLTDEANRAMRRTESMEQVLKAEETTENLPETNTYPEPRNWDEEF
jgi:hypothetical protein